MAHPLAAAQVPARHHAVVHAHPPHCTALAILRKPIPACHYMVAAFGGPDVRCAGYDTFGTEQLARMAVEAMEDRTACLLANHGMLAAGLGIDKAMWRAVELETLAEQYCLAMQLGAPVILEDSQIDETLAGFAGYGARDSQQLFTVAALRRTLPGIILADG